MKAMTLALFAPVLRFVIAVMRKFSLFRMGNIGIDR
jgi:hypothetical protein